MMIIAIYISVLIHELGHVIASILTGTRILEVAICPAPFWNVSFRILKTKITLGWMPLSGYTKLAGFPDENIIPEPPDRHHFSEKNRVQKLFMVSAGILMNMLTIIVYFLFLKDADYMRFAAYISAVMILVNSMPVVPADGFYLKKILKDEL